MSLFSLKNKTILITGASSGIGKSSAISCDKQGANLLLLGRNEIRLKETIDALSNKRHKMLIIDLINFDHLSEKLKSFLNNVDCIDGVIHAAGCSTTLPFKIFKPKKLNEIFDINVTAGFYLTRELLFKLNKNGSSIVFITSVMANLGEKAKSIYSISKGAVKSGARSLAVEYASRNIRVNTIAPGIVNTPMTKNATYKKNDSLLAKTLEKCPLGFGKPSDVASACVFLLSDGAKWITGSEIVVDGGYSSI